MQNTEMQNVIRENPPFIDQDLDGRKIEVVVKEEKENSAVYSKKVVTKDYIIKEDTETINSILRNFICFIHVFTPIFIMCLIAVLILNIFAYIKMNSTSPYFQNMMKNWNKPLIVDLSSYCDNNYKSPMIDDIWNGTVEGCLCGSTLTVGNCEGKDSSCKLVSKNTATNLNIWRGVKICKKNYYSQMDSQNYFDLDLIKSGDSCAIGYKSCGIVDSYGNIFCAKTGDICPINYLSFVENAIPNFNSTTVNKAINLSNRYFYFQNKENTQSDYISNDFTVAVNIPCKEAPYINVNYELFSLDADSSKNKTCGSVYNPQISNNLEVEYRTVDTYSQQSYYSENNILSKLTSLPNYEVSKYIGTRNVNLFQKNYFGVNLSCFNEIKSNKNNFLTYLDSFSTKIEYNNFNIVSLAFSATNVLIVIICYVIFLCSCCCDPNKIAFKKSAGSYTCLAWLFFTILLIFMLVDLIFDALTLGYRKQYSDIDKYLGLTSNCFDKTSLYVYDYLSYHYKLGLSCKIASTAILGFTIVCFIIFFICTFVGIKRLRYYMGLNRSVVVPANY